MRTGLKRIEREEEPRRVSLEVMLRGTCDIASPEGPRLLSGQVKLAEEEQFQPNSPFHHPVKHGKGLK